MNLDYEKDMQIDIDGLDVEWLEQPQLMVKYAKAAAQAHKELDKAKENLSIVESEISKEVRAEPEKFGLEKITDKAVGEVVQLDPRYKTANERRIDAQFEDDVLSGRKQSNGGVVLAVNARRDALENLVRLHGQQYFAGPRVPRDLGKEWEDRQRQKDADRRVALGMKRGKE